MKICKLLEREWYYRKFMRIFPLFASTNEVAELQLKHKIRLNYEYTFHKSMHWLFPRTLNEKLLWISFYWRHPLKALCADKYKMREYCIKKGLPENLLVPLIGVYQSADEIDFTTLPDQFVLKCNHGCGYNIIVNDKSKLSISHITHQLNNWLSICYQGGVSELHYADIDPRLIICEEYLPSLDNGSIIDYKIHCINGRPEFVLVCYDRDENEVAQLATFDFGWNQLFYCVNEEKVNIAKPKSLELMIEYSKSLSADFPFLRADFYDVDGHPYLGEMTFTPYGNMIDYYTDSVQKSLGRMLTLPPKYNRSNN